ncbi:hypothetical protein [Streptomyces sp. NPDC059566]|uniref:hypothetical protein n=1 Tax=Streptomyces sp. NPDC059566 TaxID=3346866 RepID=UPI0036ABCE24
MAFAAPAGVGPFLLFAGPDEAEAGGADIVMPIQPAPNSRRAVLRHPRGGVFEYVGP